MLSWFAVDADAPEEFKARSYKAYLMCFGSSGMFEQDDVENWVSLTNTAAGSMARRLLLNSRMGMLPTTAPVIVRSSPPEQFCGPGSAHVGYGEYNQRAPAQPLGRLPGEADGRRRPRVECRGIQEQGGGSQCIEQSPVTSDPTPPVPSSVGTPPASSRIGRACPSATSGT